MPTASKATRYRCTECGHTPSKWAGRCDGCDAWNSIEEEVAVTARGPIVVSPSEPAIPIGQVDVGDLGLIPSGLAEVDRVLGGGFTPASLTLIGGEPGIGKSTLLLQALAGVCAGGAEALYVAAEESPAQVRRRAERVGAIHPALKVVGTTELPAVLAHLSDLQPGMAIVDSIQTIYDPELSSAPGSVAQVRHCAQQVGQLARSLGVAVVLVGHVTKDGGIAGPRTLEHLVDTVVQFEGDRNHDLRTLRALKHRFGATGEIGIMAMESEGLVEVGDPSVRFLADRRAGAQGSMVTPVLDGRRSVLVEVQALVAPSASAKTSRSVHGVDSSRLAMVLAVLGRHGGVTLANTEVFALAVGGANVVDRGADLAMAMAVASSALEFSVPAELVAIGELGLGGEVRSVGGMEARLIEAQRLGFTGAIVPSTAPDVSVPIRLIRVETLREALDRL